MRNAHILISRAEKLSLHRPGGTGIPDRRNIMTVQFQLRDNEIIGAQDARNAVMGFMTEADAVIVDGAFTEYETPLQVVGDISDADTFRVELTDCGVRLVLVSDTMWAELPLGGLRREMDNFGRWFAIPA